RNDLAVLDQRAEPPALQRANDGIVLVASRVRARDAHVAGAAETIDVERHDHVTLHGVRSVAQALVADRLRIHALKLTEPVATQLFAVLDVAEQRPGPDVRVEIGLDAAERDLPVA